MNDDATANRIPSQQFASVFRWSPLPTLIVSRSDGSIVAANPASESLLGWGQDELIGTDLEAIGLSAEVWQGTDLVGGSGDQRIRAIVTKDGSPRYVLASTGPIELDHGQTHVVVLLNDVTEAERLRGELQRSEQFLQSFLDFAPAVIAARDRDGRLILRNRRFLTRFHRPSDLPEGQSDQPTLDHDTAAWSAALEATVLRTGEPARGERVILDERGIEEIWEFTKFPLRDPGGPTFAVGTIAVDVTDDRRARAALTDSEARFRQMATSLDEVFLLWEAGSLAPLYTSPAIERITGLTEEQYGDVDRRSEVVHPDDRWILSTPPAPTKEFRVIKADGQVRWLRSRTTLIETPEGEPDRGATTMTDITDQVSAEQEARTARDAAERANRAKSEFLSGMSHELRTPLNSILGFAQLLEMDRGIGDTANKQATQIIQAGRHLLDLIGDLLDISRIESGHLTTSIEAVRIGDLMDETLELVRPIADDAGVHIHLDDVDPELHVDADHRGLRQVLLNLVSNAIKYNRPDGELHIASRTGRDGMARIVVVDTGIGIAPADQDRVFETFVRLDARHPSIQGTGLGLALCKQLAELMHGEVGFESELGVGSSFWIDLPIARPASLPPVQGAPAEPSGPAASPARLLTVLLVEDNPVDIRLVEEVLALRPHVTMLSATTGRGGVAVARAEHPDLVLLDVNLPDGDGSEVLYLLSEHESTSSIPVIVTSAEADRRHEQLMLTAGARAYLAKPIDIHGLLEVIDGFGAPS